MRADSRKNGQRGAYPERGRIGRYPGRAILESLNGPSGSGERVRFALLSLKLGDLAEEFLRGRVGSAQRLAPHRHGVSRRNRGIAQGGQSMVQVNVPPSGQQAFHSISPSLLPLKFPTRCLGSNGRLANV